MLQMHTVVERPLVPSGRGSISCRPLGQEPIQFTWHSSEGHPFSPESGGSEARDLPPGRYTVEAEDAGGAKARIVIQLQPLHASVVTIERYDVSHASTSFSRDGSVQAICTGYETYDFLWSNGARTEGPLLRDVPCGTYMALPLPNKEGEPVPVVVHDCPPGVVDVSSRV
jgi:hypothetical protein